MNRRNRTLVVVGLAIVLASLASWGVIRAIQQIPVREVTIVEKQTVVASGTVPVGVLLTDKHLKLIPWPANAPVPGGFEKIEDAVGRGVTSQLVENEPVTESKLAPKDSGGGLPPNIPAGMRAMALRVNDVIGVAGFVLQGTHVDVIVTVRANNNDNVARIVANNLQMVTIGGSDLRKFKVEPSDVLFNRTNSFELVGRTAIFDLPGDYVFASYLIRLRANAQTLRPAFLNHYFNSDAAQSRLKGIASRAVSQSNISAQSSEHSDGL